MRPHEGDHVTVEARENDPLILTMQRYATVARVVDGGVIVRLEGTWPPDEEFGPIPPDRLLPGWKDNRGRWR